VDVWVCFEVLPDRVVEDVLGLVAQVIVVGDSVGVVALLPDLSGKIFSDSEGEAALDELGAAFDGHVGCGREQDVDVIGHDDEGVELEFAGVAVTEECGDEEFGSGCFLMRRRWWVTAMMA
jgi:hypothetical protein